MTATANSNERHCLLSLDQWALVDRYSFCDKSPLHNARAVPNMTPKKILRFKREGCELLKYVQVFLYLIKLQRTELCASQIVLEFSRNNNRLFQNLLKSRKSHSFRDLQIFQKFSKLSSIQSSLNLHELLTSKHLIVFWFYLKLLKNCFLKKLNFSRQKIIFIRMTFQRKYSLEKISKLK